MNNVQTALYRHFDANDNLLYVGISLSTLTRLSQHRKSEWTQDITRVDIQNFDSRLLALEAEEKAITTEYPKFNVTHSNNVQVKKVRKVVDKINKLQISLTIAPDILANVDRVAKDRGMTRAGIMNQYIFDGLNLSLKNF
jgi:predicted GIY-YIG superfamily endonuclease